MIYIRHRCSASTLQSLIASNRLRLSTAMNCAPAERPPGMGAHVATRPSHTIGCPLTGRSGPAGDRRPTVVMARHGWERSGVLACLQIAAQGLLAPTAGRELGPVDLVAVAIG